MMPNVTRGGRVAGLLTYLVGPGKANEHTSPMLVAGDERVTFETEPGAELSAADAFRVAAILDQPRQVYGTQVTVPIRQWNEAAGEYEKTGEKDAHVWHCSLSLKADEGAVSKATWGRIAEEFVQRMGFIDPDGAKSSRWVAIHHGASKAGNDHIHIAVQLVREDGTKAAVHHDFRRAQQVCGELEREFGLRVLETREASRGLSGEKPAEATRAHTEGQPQSARFELRRRMRTALATSSTPAQYLERLKALNVRVAPSFQRGSTTAVRGYKVALPGAQAGDGKSIWYSPSKLDATLGWPHVLRRYGGTGVQDAEKLLASLHTSAQQGSAGTVKIHAFDPGQIERLMSGKTGTGPDELANIYARVSLQLEASPPGALSRLSDEYARAAQGRGNTMHAVRLASRFGSKDSTRGWLAVLQQANRLSRAMTAQKLTQNRPQLAETTTALMSTVTAITHRAVAEQSTTAPTTTTRPSRDRQHRPERNGPER